jgi:hypothetical protein
LRCHVGPQRCHFAGFGLDEAQNVGGRQRTETALEHVGKLEDGWCDHRVSIESKALEELARESPPSGSLLGQKIAHARR